VTPQRSLLCAQADWLWSLKDWIDHKWMSRYGAGLADMQQQMRPPAAARAAAEQRAAAAAAGDGAAGVLAAATMRCAGCASKVPRPCAQLLYRTLSWCSGIFEYAHGTAACRNH